MRNEVIQNKENKEIVIAEAKLNNYLEYIFSSGSFEGILFDLVNPITTTENNTELSTGFIKSLPIEVILENTREIDWSFLYNNIHLVSNQRYKQIIKIVSNSYFIEKNKILDDQKNISLLHLNTPIRLPSENSNFEISSTELPSYGLKGIYTSVFEIDNTDLILSECSQDIIRDRKIIGLDYSHGIIAEANSDYLLNLFM